MRRSPIALLALAALGTAVTGAGPAPEPSLPAPTPGENGWPQYQGPDGNFRPRPATAPLTDNPNNVVMRWDGPFNMGIGKTGSRHLNYDYRRWAENYGAKDKDELVNSGANSLVAAEGKIFVNYYVGKPPYTTLYDEGKHPNAPKTFFGIQADDMLVALDAETGKVVWKAVEENSGIQVGGGKRYNWHCSPAYGGGKVFMMNPLEQVFAYDAQTGRRLWKTEKNPRLEQFRQERLKTREPLGYSAAHNGGVRMYDASLMVVGDSLVTPTGKVLDGDTGDVLWTDTENRLGSKYTRWRHGEREYILTLSGVDGSTMRGFLRLLDPRDGKLLWEYPAFAQASPPLFLDDVCLAYLTESERLPGYARPAGLRLSPDAKPEVLWELPDDLRNVVGIAGGGGIIRQDCIGDGIAVVMIRGIKVGRYSYPTYKLLGTMPKGEVRGSWERMSRKYASVQRDKEFVIIRLLDGKILGQIDNEEAGEKILGFASYFLDRNHLLMFGDTRHSGRFFTLQYYWMDPETGDWRFLGRVPVGARIITGYDTMMENPVINGNVYMRTGTGVARYDFRKPDPARTFEVRLWDAIPGAAVPDLALDFVASEVGGRLVHGTLAVAGREGAPGEMGTAVPLDCDGLTLTEEKLRGCIRSNLTPGQSDCNVVELDLRREHGAGSWKGTYRRIVPAYDHPVEVSGAATAAEVREPDAGSPQIVLELAGAMAARGSLGNPAERRTAWFALVRRDNKVASASASVSRFNGATHEVSVERWESGKDHLRAALTVIYHDDIHYHHNPETNGPTAAHYEIDLERQADSTFRGTHRGRVGIAYERAGKVTGGTE